MTSFVTDSCALSANTAERVTRDKLNFEAVDARLPTATASLGSEHLAVNDMCNFMCQFYFEVLLSLKLGQLFLVGSRVQQHMPTVHCSYFLIWVFKVASGTRHLSGLFCTSQHPTGDFRVQRLSGSLVHCIIHSHCCFYQHLPAKPGAPKDTVEASTIQLFPLHSLEVHFTQ